MSSLSMQTKQMKTPKNLDNAVPWVSFCVATYKRPEILAKTLRSIQQQTIKNFEVIVSDNDTEQSSRSVVNEIRDSRIHYFYNNENVGMVRNFNAALDHAIGSYVVLLADDDPPDANFLAEIYAMWTEYPSYGSYYGACEVLMEDPTAAAAYKSKVGKIECLAPAPPGIIRCFSKKEFPVKYFKGEVFPYILWSTGIVRRDIALEIGGMPDYGSPLLTDISYIALTGAHSGCVTVNKILGRQIVHGSNSGLTNPHNVELALKGSYEFMSKRFAKREDWLTIREAMEKYLFVYTVTHSLAMSRYFSANENKSEQRKLKQTVSEIAKLEFMHGLMFQFNWPFVNLIESAFRRCLFRLLTIKYIRQVISSIKRVFRIENPFKT